MKDLIIFGASGFGREVAWLVERINNEKNTWNLLGFMDDNDAIQGAVINGYPVIGRSADVEQYPEAYYVCAVGASNTRQKIVRTMRDINPSIHFGTVIDPSAELSASVSIGEGTIICAHSIVTVNIAIGSHVIINLDCTIGHDSVIKDFVTMYPSVNISGLSQIGMGTELGTGMQIIQGKSVGNYSVIGAGAVVINDLPDRCTAVGCPAKPIKINK